MSDARDWYVLHVPAGGEFKVETALKALGLSALVPVEWRWRKHKGRKKRWAIPLFARYVFMGSSADVVWPEVGKIEPAPVKPVSFEGRPARLSSSDVMWVTEHAADGPVYSLLRQCKAAKVTDGPAVGKTVRVDAVGIASATVAYTAKGGTRYAQLPLEHLEAIG